jgi:hypothetical protein
MKALRNDFRFFQPRGICNSADYVGGSGSSYGGSSSGSSGGGAALTQSILSSVVLAGENVALANVNPALATPVGSRPVPNPYAVSQIGKSQAHTWIVIAVVFIVGLLAFREL